MPKTNLRQAIYARLPHRRTWLRVSHTAMIPLLIWFIFVTPEVVLPFGQAAFQAHSMLALVFVTVTLLWTADYMRRGLAGRPGPKLGKRGRRLHYWLNSLIIWGLIGVAITGFVLGLSADRLLKAGGVLPFAPPLDLPTLNKISGQIHIYEFYLLGIIVVFHGAFHTWRHFKLRDNALRIMAPKALHRFL